MLLDNVYILVLVNFNFLQCMLCIVTYRVQLKYVYVYFMKHMNEAIGLEHGFSICRPWTVGSAVRCEGGL